MRTNENFYVLDEEYVLGISYKEKFCLLVDNLKSPGNHYSLKLSKNNIGICSFVVDDKKNIAYVCFLNGDISKYNIVVEEKKLFLFCTMKLQTNKLKAFYCQKMNNQIIIAAEQNVSFIDPLYNKVLDTIHIEGLKNIRSFKIVYFPEIKKWLLLIAGKNKKKKNSFYIIDVTIKIENPHQILPINVKLPTFTNLVSKIKHPPKAEKINPKSISETMKNNGVMSVKSSNSSKLGKSQGVNSNQKTYVNNLNIVLKNINKKSVKNVQKNEKKKKCSKKSNQADEKKSKNTSLEVKYKKLNVEVDDLKEKISKYEKDITQLEQETKKSKLKEEKLEKEIEKEKKKIKNQYNYFIQKIKKLNTKNIEENKKLKIENQMLNWKIEVEQKKNMTSLGNLIGENNSLILNSPEKVNYSNFFKSLENQEEISPFMKDVKKDAFQIESTSFESTIKQQKQVGRYLL